MSERDYRSICISMYDVDIEQLDAKVADLKARGYRRAGRSMVIRMALGALDTRNLEPGDAIPSRITSRPVTRADAEAAMQADPHPPRAEAVAHEMVCVDCKFIYRTRASRGPKTERCAMCRVEHARKLREAREAAPV